MHPNHVGRQRLATDDFGDHPTPHVHARLAFGHVPGTVCAQPRGCKRPLFVNEGKLYASSLDVAAFFNKKHKNVLQSVSKLLESQPHWGGLNFQPSSYTTPQGKKQPSFDMTRDGFSMLAMGFTGTEAEGFKIAYISQFNAMEAELKKPFSMYEIPQTLADALRLAADQSEQIEQQKMQLAISLPKAGALDRIATTDGTHCLMDAAKLLQVSGADRKPRHSPAQRHNARAPHTSPPSAVTLPYGL